MIKFTAVPRLVRTEQQSVLRLRNHWAGAVKRQLEPGEHLQVVVPVRTGVARNASSLLVGAKVVEALDDGASYLLVVTDRALIPARRGSDGSIRLRERCARGSHLEVGQYQRLGDSARMYSVDERFAEHVRAANDALDAGLRGDPWSLRDWTSRPMPGPRPVPGLLGA